MFNAFLKISAVILAFYLATGCYNFYKATTTSFPQQGMIYPLVDMHKTLVIHSGTSAFLINNITIENDSLKGNFASDYVFPYKKNKFPVENSANRYMKKKGDGRILNEVHLYLQNLQTKLLPGYSEKSFALKDISRIDIYNPDSGRTAISWVLGFVVGVAAAYVAFILVLILILALSGGSCPYIYVNTGDGFTFAGEIYSGAIYAPLERNDYLSLPRLVAENGNYKLKISNELNEIQFTNLTELIVIDHPDKSEVLIDKYGNYQTTVQQSSPLIATNFAGTDILNLVKNKDSLSYCGIPSGTDIPLTDGVILTFKLPKGVSSGKVFLRSRNSLWLDNVYKNSHDLFGSYYNNWTKKKNKSDSKELLDWSLNQKIPLSVFIEKNGEWVFCDYFNMAGPAALKEDVLAIGFKGINNGPVKIKFESGTCFWEIDYVGIDYSINIPVGLKTVTVDKAITNQEDNVTDLLKYDDLKYYVQPENTNIADLSFPASQLTDSKRTIILHSKGYYQILSMAKGLPKIKKLKAIREPGQFLEYSRNLMKTQIENLRRNQ